MRHLTTNLIVRDERKIVTNTDHIRFCCSRSDEFPSVVLFFLLFLVVGSLNGLQRSVLLELHVSAATPVPATASLPSDKAAIFADVLDGAIRINERAAATAAARLGAIRL